MMKLRRTLNSTNDKLLRTLAWNDLASRGTQRPFVLNKDFQKKVPGRCHVGLEA